MDKQNHTETISAGQLYSIFESLLNAGFLEKLQKTKVTVRGVLIRTPYGFPAVADGDKQIGLDVNGSRADFSALEGKPVEVTGTVLFRSTQFSLIPKLRVTDLSKDIRCSEDVPETVSITANPELSGILERIHRTGLTLNTVTELKLRQNWQQKELLRVLVISGKGAQTGTDFHKAFYQNVLPELRDRVRLDASSGEVALSNDQALAELLLRNSTKGYDLMFVVRGGGSTEELARLGGIETAKAILTLAEQGTPVYSATGHSLDIGLSVLEKASLQTFSTPSIAGSELAKAVNTGYTHVVASTKLEELEREFQKTLAELEARKRSRLETLGTGVLIGVVIGFLLFLILK